MHFIDKKQAENRLKCTKLHFLTFLNKFFLTFILTKRKKMKKLPLLLWFLLIGFNAITAQETEIKLSKSIKENTILSSNNIYHIGNILAIDKGVTLTIEEGVSFKTKNGKDLKIILSKTANLIINGSKDAPIKIITDKDQEANIIIQKSQMDQKIAYKNFPIVLKVENPELPLLPSSQLRLEITSINKGF